MATASAPPGTRVRSLVARGDARVLVAGAACFALVAAATATGWPESSPLVPEHDAPDGGLAWAYLVLVAAAFASYLGGLYLLHRGREVVVGAVVVIACAVQLVPLAGPVLLSTDVYTYWDYGRIGAVHSGNPYVDEPSSYPDDPAYALMGGQWRDTTSAYGPGFTLASEAHAAAVGDSPDAAAWAYKTLAAVAMIVLVLLAARLGRRPAFSAAFVGWNPLLAIHFAGGGHNDSWMMALVLGALALGAAGRRGLAGAAWALAAAVKWLPLALLPLRYLEARRQGRPVRHLGFAFAAAGIAAVATWRYGTAWLGALGPVADNLVSERAAYSIPVRVSGLGVPEGVAVALFAACFALAYVWLLREAWRGRARLALAAGLMLVTTSWLVPWYAVWAVPLAAIEEDRAARLLALFMSAYLLRDAVPL